MKKKKETRCKESNVGRMQILFADVFSIYRFYSQMLSFFVQTLKPDSMCKIYCKMMKLYFLFHLNVLITKKSQDDVVLVFCIIASMQKYGLTLLLVRCIQRIMTAIYWANQIIVCLKKQCFNDNWFHIRFGITMMESNCVSNIQNNLVTLIVAFKRLKQEP